MFKLLLLTELKFYTTDERRNTLVVWGILLMAFFVYAGANDFRIVLGAWSLFTLLASLIIFSQDSFQWEFLLTRAVPRRDVFHAKFLSAIIIMILPVIPLAIFTFLATPYLRILFRITEPLEDAANLSPWLIPAGICMALLTFCGSVQIATFLPTNSTRNIVMRILSIMLGAGLLGTLIALSNTKLIGFASHHLLYIIVALELSAVLFFTSRITFEKKGLY